MSNKKSHKSHDINVPSDILFCILIRLPVKSLLRFRYISTSWNDIISDREFKKAQSNKSKALGRVNFLLQRRNEFKFINLENHRVIAIEEQRFPLKGFERVEIVCSHDGLVLLKNRRAYKTFVLWNPSTRQCLKLASCPYLNTYTHFRGYGLCYDPTTDEYKVILIYESFYLVYSARNNFWMKKTTLPRLTNYSWLHKGITTESCVYWYIDQLHTTIIYFDVNADELKELPAPNFVGDNKTLFCLIALKGRLCLYHIRSNDESKLDMWIMEEDGWKLLMKLPKVSPEFDRFCCLLCCMENGEIIFHNPKDRHISIYNPKQQEIM